jgi:Transposase DDE domain
MGEEPKIAVLADEDVEEDPDRWCSYSACGQDLWQIACQWVWNLRLTLGKTLQGGKTREIEWAPAKPAPPFLVPEESSSQEYGPWQQAAVFGRAAGRLGADAFVLQEDGTLRCPAGASLWLSEVRQENALTQRALYVASQTDCPHCPLREQCLGRNAKGNRARRGESRSVVSYLPLPRLSENPSFSNQCSGSTWQAEPFVAPGRPTGASNMLRCFQ